MRAALTALSTSTNLRDLLDASIAYTGDVDTVATIALGAGSCATDIEHNLPPELYETLENGPFGATTSPISTNSSCSATRATHRNAD